jgi:RHS repeat-associated protein
VYADARTNYYAFDPEGSTADLVNGSGQLVSQFYFDAYGYNRDPGVDAPTTDDHTGPFAQWGAESAPNTQLVQMGHRVYDPYTGRWVTRDPIGYAGGINLYEYAEDQPDVLSDPSGLFALALAPPLLDTVAPAAAGGLASAAGLVAVGILAGADLYHYAETGQANGPFTSIGNAIGNDFYGTPSDSFVPTVSAIGGTYVLRNRDTGVPEYVGRTNDLARREREHGRNPALNDLDFDVDKETDDYDAQRGREDIIYGRARGESCPLRNKNRPIAPGNPNGDRYREAGEALGE